MSFKTPAITLVTAALLGGCGFDETPDLNQVNPVGTRANSQDRNQLIATNTEIITRRAPANPERNAYFGDLHVHTAYSFDAYSFGTTASPYEAYRYARGEALMHPAGYEVQLQQALDFYAVTDHAMFLGVVKEAADTNSAFSRLPIAEPIHNINAPNNMSELSLLGRSRAFASFIPDMIAGLVDGSIDPLLTEQIAKAAWLDTVKAADEFNTPGEFTTFAAYEYTSSTDDKGNLHRNVIFKSSTRLPAVPFSRFNSQDPEGLWDWMDGLRDEGIESLAIPHNSNGSNGQMFTLTDWAGNPIDDDYASKRLRNEPLVEITQVKGTSDTHPLLSKNDEWANFEIMPYRVATTLPSSPPGSYVRDAYLRGLSLSEQGVANPYRFGLIGSSDTHTGAISQDEATFFSKSGVMDGTAERRGSVPASFLTGTIVKWGREDLITEVDGEDYLRLNAFETWSASGLAAVWAEENTRSAIYEAFRRKETFATTGPRIRLRFFAGFNYPDDLLNQPNMTRLAYREGVTMGGDLTPAHSDRAPTVVATEPDIDAGTVSGRATVTGTGTVSSDIDAPRFLVWALADSRGTALQRAQIIKGWVRNGQHHERLYDVACSDGIDIDPTTHRCADNGARVNLDDCSITADVGTAELKTLWRDPDFDPTQEAFYYLRVLENPTCRWSTWDAVNAGVAPRGDLATTIQERAWSSPIWYRPGVN